MTTTPSTSSNKTALRASLKKEDDSLAERLVATDVPLVAPTEPEAPATVPVRKVAAKPATPAAKPAPAKSAAAKPTVAKPATAKPATAKSAAEPAAVATAAANAKAPKAKKAPLKTTAAATAAPAKAKQPAKKAASAVKPTVSAKPTKPQARVEGVLATAKVAAGKKAAKLGQAVGKLEKTAKEKGDKLVRYSVDLLKSEEAAIEALRAELSKAAGWAASKSDILRAGARLFAEQKVEQMKELLAGLAAASKAGKKG